MKASEFPTPTGRTEGLNNMKLPAFGNSRLPRIQDGNVRICKVAGMARYHGEIVMDRRRRQ